jgi:hypothetical protein
VAARPQADGAAQCLVDPLPDAVQTPLAEGRIGGVPRRILAWEIAPGAPSAQDIKLTFRTLFSRSMMVFKECSLAKRGMVLSHPTRA